MLFVALFKTQKQVSKYSLAVKTNTRVQGFGDKTSSLCYQFQAIVSKFPMKSNH